MKRYLNKVNSVSVVCILILLQITATLCFEMFNENELRISKVSELSDESIINEIIRLRYGVIEKMVITDNNFTTLPEDVFNSVSNVNTLEVNRNPLTTLPANIFRQLDQLKLINFNENQLKTLPANIFQGQAKLETIFLCGNNLTRINGTIFADTPNLNSLHLCKNQLKALPGNIFNGLSNLEILNLGHNHLKTLPTQIFQNLGILSTLNLHGNQLTSLPEDIFNGSRKLWHLALGGNNFTELPANILKEQLNLNYLLLSENQLTMLPANIFQDLGNLKELELSKNQISSLPENIFNGLHRLWYLHLDENNFTSLPENIFNGLKRLSQLHLAGNKLTTLSANIFQDLGELWILNITSNQISVLPEGIFDELGQLKHLHLDENQLKSLSVNIFQNQTRLRELNLNQNQLTELPENIFQNLINLSKLKLSGNKLTTLPKNIFSTQKYLLDPGTLPGNYFYEYITCKTNLNDNPWICDDEFLEIFKNLKSADIDDIVCSDGQMIGYKIRTEKLSHVCPTECSCRLMNNGTTLDFNCSSGNLTNIPTEMGKGLQQIPELREIILNLDNNDIETLPNSTMPGFELITKITAKNNSIKSIDFDNLPPNLSEIDLSGNKLESLSPEVIEELSNMEFLKKLVLAGNPWKCDDVFIDFVRSNIEVVDYEHITCADGKLVNEKVDELVYLIKGESEDVDISEWTNSYKVIRMLKHEDDLGQICPPECNCLVAEKNTTISYKCLAKSLTRILNHYYSGKRYWPAMKKWHILD